MIDRFLEDVRAEHRSKVSDAVLTDALKEIRAHLEDSRDAFLASGHKTEEAEKLAVKAFGDPSLVLPTQTKWIELTVSRDSLPTIVTVCLACLVPVVVVGLHFPGPTNSLANTFYCFTCTGILATFFATALKSGKVFLTATLLTFAASVVIVYWPTANLMKPWSPLGHPTSNRVAHLNDAKNAQLANAALAAKVEALTVPNALPYRIERNGKTVYPRTLEVTQPHSTSVLVLDQTNFGDISRRPYFPDERTARIVERKRIPELVDQFHRICDEDVESVARANAMVSSPLISFCDYMVENLVRNGTSLAAVLVLIFSLQMVGAALNRSIRRLTIPRAYGG